jgi:MATE family multidrug resistance protein
VLWFELLAMAAFVCLRRYREPTRLFERFSPPDPRRLAALVRLGVPIGLASFFEVAAFSIVTLLVARLGAVAVAAQQIAFSINGILFMIPMSLGMAATIRIGHHLGAGRRDDARHTARVAMTASVSLGLAFAAFVAFLRTPLVALYTTEPDVVRLGARLLLFLAVYIVVDSMQATAIGALRGYKDTRAPMLITLFGYWIVAVPLGSGLGLGWVGPGLGVDGFWIGLATGLAVVAFGLSARLLRVAAPRPRAAV